MAPSTQTQPKDSLRQRAKQIRKVLKNKGGFDAVEAATHHAKQLIKGIDPSVTIGLYYPIGDEMETRLLAQSLQTMGRQTALPVVTGKDQPLQFKVWEIGDPLVDGMFNTKQPEDAAPTVTPGFLIVPLLGYDNQCYRLGYGGGFYDRTLMAMPIIKAFGLAYGGQIIDNLPREDHDVPMHGIITDSGLILPQQ